MIVSPSPVDEPMAAESKEFVQVPSNKAPEINLETISAGARNSVPNASKPVLEPTIEPAKISNPELQPILNPNQEIAPADPVASTV